MSPASPDSTLLQEIVCARCGSVVEGAREGSSCPACMASDLAGVEWSDLLAPGSGELLAGGGFTLLEEIGRGGMGIVYRARQRSPEREVALKLLPPSFSGTSDGALRLMAEAGMMAEMDHPGILPLYASGVQDGRPWLAMKLASGGTLAGRKAEWRGRWRECAELAAGLADAVQHAHERGLIHRDLKPANILFDESGRAYVGDFGVAKWRDMDSGLTHTNMVLGTPAYMAPEVARADVRAATTFSDVYGLGAILYFLLCGQPPFPQASTLEILRRIVDEDPAPPRKIVPDVPGDLQVICLKALARQPSARYSGPDAMAADLRRWLAGESIEARPSTRGEKFLRWVRRHPLSAGLSAALIATIAGSGIILWQKNTELSESLTRTSSALTARSEALETAENSRKAAYAAFSYVMREMPSRFADRGRLGDFDDIFKNVEAQLLALGKAGGPEDNTDLAHLAELYVLWSRVLSWSGRPEDSERMIKKAVSLAEEVMHTAEPVAEAWKVLSAAHRLQGKFLIEDEEEFTKGRTELEKASAAVSEGLARFPGDLGLRVEKADVAGEIADSHVRDGDWPALTKTALEAQKLWTALKPALTPGVPLFLREREREKGPYPLYMLGYAAEKQGDAGSANKHYNDFLKEREKQLAEEMNSGERQFEVAVAANRAATSLAVREPYPMAEITPALERVESLTTALIQRDPTNERWRVEWAGSALCMAFVCKQENKTEKRIEWLEECLRRLEPAGKSRRAGILECRMLALQKLAHASNDVADADAPWERYLEASKEFAASTPVRWKHHQDYMDALKDTWGHYEHRADAATLEKMARRWIAEARDAGPASGGSPYWKAAESSSHRRLADLLASQGRKEDARAANLTALTLRDELFHRGGRFAYDLIDHICSASVALLEIQPESDEDARRDAELVLTTMTELAPIGLASGKGGDWQKKWKDAGDKAVLVLPEGKRTLADAALDAALYPPSAPAVAKKQLPEPKEKGLSQ